MSMVEMEDENGRELVKVGEVSSVDYEKGTARVVFDDEEGFVSNDLQVLQRNTQENQDFWMPDVGEDVVCLFLPNGMEDGFIVGSFYADEITPPESGENKRYIKFKDESEIEYDWEKHRLFARVGKTQVEVTGNSVHISGAENVKVSVPNIEFVGDLKVSGNISANGEVTAKSESAPVNLSTHIHPTAVGPTSAPTQGT